MPKKNIREMSEAERKRYSLAAKTFHVTIVSAIILEIVALLVGLVIYGLSLGEKYVEETYVLTRNVEAVIQNVADVNGYGKETMRIYNEATDEAREGQNVRYLSDFAKVRFDENYIDMMAVLRQFSYSSNADYLYIAMYDDERNALVFIADADKNTATAYRTGMWMSVSEDEVEKFLSVGGKERIYHISHDPVDGWICTSGVPLYDRDGSISCFILADVSLIGLIKGMRDFAINFFVATTIMVFVLSYFMVRHMKKTLVKPIDDIAMAAEAYVNDKKSGKNVVDHFKGLDIDTGDEIENLYFILADMETELKNYETNLTAAVKEKERIGTELDLANRIQEGMLPRYFPAFPDRKDFDIYASMIPAKEVGGDFYDFFLIDEDHLCLLIADVSGKGVPAALFMMASKILLKTEAMSGKSPAKILETVNNQIVKNNSQEMFVTVWLGILELSTGKLTAANAGHEYPLIMHADKSFELFKDKHGFVIGGLEGMKYSEYDIHMEPGARIYVYTDGVTEATAVNGELYSTTRLVAAINEIKEGTPKEIINKINRSVKNYTGTAPQFDDVTMLCLSYAGPDAMKDPEHLGNTEGETLMKEMTLEATISNIPKVTDFVNVELEALECPIKAQMQIDVAIDELFGNIAQYAYDPSTGPATVRVEVEEDPMAVIITFIDNGKPYDPLSGQDPDVTLSASEREIGGLGVFLVKKTMDEITYEYKNGQNILRIRKKMQEGS